MCDLLVLIRPCYDSGLSNRLFAIDPRSKHWNLPYRAWRDKLAEHGVQLDTWDLHPIEEAHLVWIQDLTPTRGMIERAKPAGSTIPFAMLQYESPIDREHFHDCRNHDLFDVVASYNTTHSKSAAAAADGGSRLPFYHDVPLPNGRPSRFPESLAFADRKPMVMINRNKDCGLLGNRKPGMVGLPVIGPRLGNWKTPWGRVMSQGRRELFSARRRLARLADRDFSGLLEIYGDGWQGQPINTLQRVLPIFRERPYSNSKGRLDDDKLETMSRYRFCLAYENTRDHIGYISEKIFDCFYAGVVPIYLGDANILDHVPAAAFVDARQFKSDSDLLEYVNRCTESAWADYLEAGRAYRDSVAIKKFEGDHFVDRMTRFTLELVGKPI